VDKITSPCKRGFAVLVEGDGLFDDTFFLVWRGIIKHEVFADPNLFKVWIWCLAKASYTERSFTITTGRGQSLIKLNSGQFLFGRNKAAGELLMSPSSVRNRMDKLKELECVDIQPDSHYTVVTIVNWGKRQSPFSNNGQLIEQASNRQVTGNEQASNRQVTHTNKDNKDNKDNKYSPAFLEFWKAYPLIGRSRTGKDKCWEVWKKGKFEQQFKLIMKALSDWMDSELWNKDDGQYIKNPTTWLKDGKWKLTIGDQ